MVGIGGYRPDMPMGSDFYQGLACSAFIRGLAATLSLKMPSALTCSSNIEN